MADINKTIKDIEECLSASCRGYKPKMYCPHSDEEWDIMRDALELLKELNIKGHWIPIGGVADCNGVRIHSFKCSECGERTDRVDTNRHINFCPMCGTAMKEDETH